MDKRLKDLVALATHLKVIDKLERPISRLDSRKLSIISLRLNAYMVKEGKGNGYVRTSRVAKYLCRLVREQDPIIRENNEKQPQMDTA